MSSKRSAVEPSECENFAKESERRQDAQTETLSEKQNLCITSRSKYELGALHGRLQNFWCGLRTYQSKSTKFNF